MFGLLTAPYGWAYDLAEGLAASMVRSGHQVRVVSTNSGWPRLPNVALGNPTPFAGATLEYFPADSIVLKTNFRLARTLAPSTQLARAMPALVRAADVVHVHMLYTLPSIVAARAAIRDKKPFIVSPYGSLDPYMHFRRGRIRKELFLALFRRQVLDRANAIHFMSQLELKSAEAFGLKAESAVVHLGIDLPKYNADQKPNAFRARYGLGGRKLVTYLGRLSYTKGLDLLVRAFSRIAGKHPGAHLVFVGPDYENYQQVILRVLDDCGLTARATFTGFVDHDEKINALHESDVFVLPSYTEAFGLVMLEAMACRCPVITTDRAALAAELASAGAAHVVGSDSEALAGGIDEFLSDNRLRAEVGLRGYNLVRERFTVAHAASRLLDLYSKVLDGGEQGQP